MTYWTDGDKIRFATTNLAGYFVIGTDSPQEREYLAWLAEGNEPQEWNPEEIG